MSVLDGDLAVRDDAPPLEFAALLGGELGLRVKIVDIGANPIGGAPPYASMLRAGVADIVGFEPNPAALAELRNSCGPNELYLADAIGDGQDHMLRCCFASGMTSLLQPDEAVLALFHGFADWGRVTDERTIATVRLDDVAPTEGADFIKLDIQGAELMVLRHAARRLAEAVVVQAEVEFMPLYRDQPLFSDVDMFLRSQGFMLHRFFPQVSRVVRPLCLNGDAYAGLSQMVWADAVFIRDITRLERLSDRQLLAMAMILHECYGSFDVALHLLAGLDRRRGTTLGDRYLAGLQRQFEAGARRPSGG